MGNHCGQSPLQQVTTAQNPQQQQIANTYAQLMGLDHPANINNKYKHIQKVIPEQYTGSGIRKTNAYKSLVTKEDLIKKRQEFWETTVTGQQECCQTLRAACEQDENNALSLLVAAGVKLVNKSVQMAYDELGNKYEVPIFCVNDPLAYEPIKHTTVNFIREQITVKIRSAKITKDEELNVSSSIHVNDLKKLYQLATKMEELKIRFFFNGKELLDQVPIGGYGIKNNSLIQAFVINK